MSSSSARIGLARGRALAVGAGRHHRTVAAISPQTFGAAAGPAKATHRCAEEASGID
jgi:hypothetical protein